MSRAPHLETNTTATIEPDHPICSATMIPTLSTIASRPRRIAADARRPRPESTARSRPAIPSAAPAPPSTIGRPLQNATMVRTPSTLHTIPTVAGRFERSAAEQREKERRGHEDEADHERQAADLIRRRVLAAKHRVRGKCRGARTAGDTDSRLTSHFSTFPFLFPAACHSHGPVDSLVRDLSPSPGTLSRLSREVCPASVPPILARVTRELVVRRTGARLATKRVPRARSAWAARPRDSWLTALLSPCYAWIPPSSSHA